MSREKPRNLAASVRQRLFNRAQERHEDFGLVLTKYGLERFLYRLSESKYRDQFVLKGALLFELWTHRPYRPTRDLDLEGRGENSIPRIKRLFAEIIGQAVADDGLVFDPESLHVARRDSRAAFSKAASNCPIALSRPTSATRSTSSSSSNAAQEDDTFRRFSKSELSMPSTTNTNSIRSTTRNRSRTL